uniref:NPC1 like intracellular cholesterol transporter 1 n=1 Tax=Sinocyclocheilus grahami TaxID=75366 RepID=A0A672MMM3_SINGR
MFLLYLCLLQVLTGAQHEPGYCSFYEDCGLNPAVEGALIPPRVPCKDYRKAVNVTGDHYELFKSVCPMLAHGEGETLACCSIRQLTALQDSLTLSKAVLIRCPSCADNFAHMHCATTCSPNQSQILKIMKTANITQPTGIVKEAVVGYEAYVSTSFSDASFRSCKNVRIPATGGYAIATMCGRYGATLCTPQRWLDFQGDSSNGLAPLDINFKLLPDGQTAGLPPGAVLFAGTALNCNETTPTGGEACSCQDCEQSCPAVPQPPPLPEPFMIGQLDGVLVICIIVFSCILLLLTCYVILEYTIHYQKSKGARKGKNTKDQNENEIERKISPKDVTCSDKASLATQEFLGSLFQTWGTIMARYPLIVLPVCLVVVLAFAVGIKDIELTTDPVQLWSAPQSRAMREKAFHDANFDPFYRTNQLILTAPDSHIKIYCVCFFHTDLIIELLELQQKIQAIELWSDELNRTASLKDVCYAPLNPDNPSLTDCAVNSLPQYFQNSMDKLNAKANMTELGVTKEVDWRDHFIYCVNSPLSFKDITALGMSCMADYGGPVFPFLAVGGYENEEYTTAEALILTFSLNNYARTDVKFKVAEEWEQRFLEIVQEYQKNTNTNFTFAYMAERSLEDEINRTTAEDIPIFMISYAVIFLYIAVALGEYTSWKRILVDSKFLVGLGGILVVGCSVMASMGFYAWIGFPSSLVILQVVPFLVLAVGADNIFIFVLEYQRDMRRPGEKREEQIGRVLGNVAPSMLLCSLSESVCFFLGALSTMPAVRSFALYAALAVLMDFILQMTAFVALLSLDAQRQDANRCEIACCVTVKTPHPSKPNQGILLPLMKKYYAPALLNSVSRVLVVRSYFANIVGLNQELAMPSDSYMLDYFAYLYKYFEVGVPTYFITTKGFNFTSEEGINAVCSSVGCDQFSFTQKIRYATEYPESYLAIPASSWVDDYIDWLNPGSKCCRIYTAGPNKDEFCPANESKCFYIIYVTYVYYEQYLTIVNEGLFNIGVCLLPTFVVCCILLGMDLRSGFLNLLTIVMITVDTVGVMTLWGIDFNAVSLINLVTAVGISVEFVSHLTRSFALSIQPTKVERAKEATANMGSAVFAGVAMTNLPGIVVLAFAKAQLIQIFFFRLNLVITLLGMAHGLIFLPVLLSFLGPGVNNAVLLQIQEKKAKEMELNSKATYDNISFESHEK